MHMLLALILVAADQVTKWWARTSFSHGESRELGLGFSFTHVSNTGAAFGLLHDFEMDLGVLVVDGTLLLGLLSAIVSVLLTWYIVSRGSSIPPLARLALVLVLGGAVGNMIDRIWLGHVIDFIHFQSGDFNFPVFNLADTFVVVGGALLFLTSLGEGGRKEDDRKLVEPGFFRGLDRNDP